MAKVSNFFKELLRLLSEEFIRTWLFPAATTVGVGVIGWFESLPWFYILLGSGVMFAAATTGVLRFSEWRFRVTTKDKLSFQNIRIARILSEQGQVTGVRLGLQVHNQALYPIEFERIEMQTSLNGLYPNKIPYQNNVAVIPPNGWGFFDDHGIDLGQTDRAGKIFEGSLYARLVYGRPNKLDREMEIKKKIFVKFSVQGDIEVCEWAD